MGINNPSLQLSVGTLDSQTPSANALVLVGSSLYAQSASSTNPGVMNTSTQSFAGNKTFLSTMTVSPSTDVEALRLKQFSATPASTSYFIEFQNSAASTLGYIDPNANWLGGDGTSAAPSLSFKSQSGMGLYKNSTNVLGFVTAGTEWMQLNATGKLALGTTATTDTLSVAGNIRIIGNNQLRFTDASTHFLNMNAAAVMTASYTLTWPAAVAAATGQALTSDTGGNLSWTSIATNPMTTGGDLIYGGASGTPTRLANGTTGQYLQSAGGTSAPAWASFTSHTVTVLTTGTAATYTTPAGCKAIWVRAIGQGGGGGGAAGAANANAAAGGGGGGYSEKFITNPAATYIYTVGTSGGGGGAAGNNNGTAGSSTTFSGGSLVANGGSGGSGASNNATTPVFGTSAASGGAGSGGDVNGSGGVGAPGLILSAAQASGGQGGSSVIAAGAQGIQGTANGISAQGFGAGGSGASTVSGGAAKAGGNGAPGVIIIHEFYNGT